MMSVLGSGSIGLGLSSGLGSALFPWARRFTLTVTLSPPRCLMGTSEFNAGVTL